MSLFIESAVNSAAKDFHIWVSSFDVVHSNLSADQSEKHDLRVNTETGSPTFHDIDGDDRCTRCVAYRVQNADGVELFATLRW